MPSPQDARNTHSQASIYDCIIIGGGIFGLSLARALIKAGSKVLIIDKGKIGQGASYGLLGALMPHMPARWNDKKLFQFNSLNELPKVKVEIEQETGQSIGYEQCGRIVPLSNSNLKGHSQIRSDEAEKVWQREHTGYYYALYPKADYEGWLNPDACPEGYAFDNLSARANPRAYCAALKSSIANLGGAILEDCTVKTIRDNGPSAEISLSDGTHFSASTIAITAGYESFPLLETLTGKPELGQGVKGQSLLAKVGQPKGVPIIYDRGAYVVPHDNGLCAIGSTSENDWTDATSTDEQLEAIWTRAREICPMLEGAEILTRWAGIRPKATLRDPMVGFLPGSQSLYVATGGFKISYGIAHHIAQISMERITGAQQTIKLPESFEAERHLTSR